MPRATTWVVGFLCGLALLACTDPTKRLTEAQRQQVMQFVSKAETKPQHPLAIKFGDHATLIGYDTSPETLEPGQGLTVTWHWRVDKAFPDGWREFTHLADAKDVSRLNLDAAGTIRQSHPPSAWAVGSYIRDAQVVSLPKDWKSPQITFYLGFWKGEERLPVTGPQDDANRARALTLDVGTPDEAAIELHAARAEQPPKLDGKLDEAAWASAPATPSFVNTLSGATADPKVSVKTLWDDTNLYVAFDVADEWLRSTFEKRDDHLWEQDAVEIMLDPDGDGKNYFELQVAPSNQAFDTRYDSRRKPQPFGHMEWNSGLTSGVSLRGTLNDQAPDQGYTAEIAIPWTAFAAGTPVHARPRAGDTWRVNFYVMDAREEGQRAVGWSPPRVGDFHVPKRFGKLHFDALPLAAAETDSPAAAPAPRDVPTGKRVELASKADKATAKAAGKKKPAAPASP